MYLSIRPIFISAQLMIENCASKIHQKAMAESAVGFNPDFNLRSVRGSAVVRWEFRPGSALYVVWNENRSEVAPLGDFQLRRDFSSLPDAPSQDVFLIKFSYWLPI